MQVKPAKTSQSTRSVALNQQRTKGPRSKGIFVFFYRLSFKRQGAEEKHWHAGLFKVRRVSSVALNAFFTTPKSFPQHISFCRTVAISIPVVRPRCSEQRITGVVNKLLPCSPPRVLCRLLYYSKAALRSQLCPLSKPRRGAVSLASCHFAAFRAKEHLLQMRKL